MPYLAAGKLDRRLFDVTGLLEQGYDDQHSDGIPLIVSHGAGAVSVASEPAVPAGTTTVRELPSINGTAVRAAKKQARDAWRSLTAAPAVASLSAAAGRVVRATASRRCGWTAGCTPRWPRAPPRSARRRPGRPATTAPASRSRCSTPGPTSTTRTSPAGSADGGQLRARRVRHGRQRARHPYGLDDRRQRSRVRRARRRASLPAPTCSSARCSATAASARTPGSSPAWSGPPRPGRQRGQHEPGRVRAERRHRSDEPGGQPALGARPARCSSSPPATPVPRPR